MSSYSAVHHLRGSPQGPAWSTSSADVIGHVVIGTICRAKKHVWQDTHIPGAIPDVAFLLTPVTASSGKCGDLQPEMGFNFFRDWSLA